MNLSSRVFAGALLTALAVGAAANDLRIDRSSPEAVLESYIEALKRGDVKGVEACLTPRPDLGKFNLPEPVPITRYEITKRIVYGVQEVEDWNSKGIDPPAKLNDVEFHVREFFKNGNPKMFSYNFRKDGSEWRIVSGAQWTEKP